MDSAEHYERHSWGNGILYVQPDYLTIPNGTLLWHGPYGFRWLRVEMFSYVRTAAESDIKR